MSADAARAAGLTSTVVFPVGNIAPEGSVIKATAIDPSVVGADGVYRHRGPARVFVSRARRHRRDQGAARRRAGQAERRDRADRRRAARHGHGGDLPAHVGAEVSSRGARPSPIVTDARFSGVSTGACIGHVGPEALAGGPIGKLRRRRRHRDRHRPRRALTRTRRTWSAPAGRTLDAAAAARAARVAAGASRACAPHAELPDDTRLWAALQQASGGTWGGCVYDVDRIIEVIGAGVEALDRGRKQ